MARPSLLPVVKWQAGGPESAPRSVLRGETKFFGIPYMAVAIPIDLYELEELENGKPIRHLIQRGSTTWAQVELERWQRASGSKGLLETLLIDGKPHVVFLHPKSTTGSDYIKAQSY